MAKDERDLVKVHPSWWKVLGWLLLAFVVVPGLTVLWNTVLEPESILLRVVPLFIMVIPLAIASWKHYSIMFRVTNRRVIVERGLLAKKHREIGIRDIRVVDIERTILQLEVLFT